MKKIIVFMLMFLPLGAMAQNVKIGMVSTQEIFNLMPEVAEFESEAAKQRKEFEGEMKGLQDEYNRKYADFTAQGDTLSENIKAMRIQEIQDIQTRMENYAQLAQERMQKSQQDMVTKVSEKISKATKEVGDEGGFTYIFVNNNNIILYAGNSATDLTEKVKAKLGVK